MVAARRILDSVLYVLSSLTLAVIVGAVALEVFFRFIVRSSLPWSGEVGTMGLVWMSSWQKLRQLQEGQHPDRTPSSGSCRARSVLAEFGTNLLLLGCSGSCS